MNSLHIELTSRCVLECSACPRTWFKQTLQRPVPKLDMDLAMLDQFLDCEAGQQITHFHLESNHGDCIYYPKLLEFIARWRDSKTFSITTNGSRQSQDFWHSLNQLLTDRDQIIFSVDGLAHNNHLYRVNSDWPSLENAINIAVQGPAKIIWKTIVFSYNQHEIHSIRTQALQMGVDEFATVHSHRFGADHLVPDTQYIDTSMLYKNLDPARTVSPKCGKHSKETFLTPEGYCWPCCWISSYFTLHKTDLWKNRQLFSMRSNNLDQVINNIEQYAQSLAQDSSRADSVCKLTCGA